MNEGILVSAVLESRKAYENIITSIDYEDFSEYAGMVLRYSDEYYRGDPAAQQIDRDTVASALGRHFPNPKQTERAVAWLERLPEPASPDNVAREYRLLQRHNVALELAAQLGAGNHGDKTDALVARYTELGSPPMVEEDGEGERLDLESLAEAVGEGNRIKLLPGILNESIGGGVLRGHNIVIYARPEAGKTLLAINLGAGFTRQGLRVLHTGNEEPLRDLHYRYLSRMARMPISDIQGNAAALREAEKRARARGWNNLVLKELTTARVTELESMVSRYVPDVLIVDQIKNLQVRDKSGNRASELDTIAQEIRRLGKQYGMVTVSVTQAGDSADEQLKLGMGDVEWSNTGIPGAADLMIGLGVNDEYAATNRRMISLPKNKINGNRGAFFPVFIEPQYSACLSEPLRRN